MRKVIGLFFVALFAVLVLTAANPTPTSAAAPVSYYVVRYGDTLDGIGWHYGVSAWAIARANGIWNPNHIYAGQVLYIPCHNCWYPPTPPCPWPGLCPSPRPGPQPWPGPYRCMYQVRYGDTMSGIAWRLGTDAWTLARFNGIYNLNWIYAGQWLRIPRCYL
ncbi:MAG: LysM peptidoglycan-binding domain-containing protein [Anaerolineales bacterium]|nr:LysM peptidoglycan-binding domain-containing protein [Anaerolineales bacterium]